MEKDIRRVKGKTKKAELKRKQREGGDIPVQDTCRNLFGPSELVQEKSANMVGGTQLGERMVGSQESAGKGLGDQLGYMHSAAAESGLYAALGCIDLLVSLHSAAAESKLKAVLPPKLDDLTFDSIDDEEAKGMERLKRVCGDSVIGGVERVD
ncbi:hypothetical protein F2P56_037011 [Juglans regia]|uniref:Uncharacterized protein n=1 Tax=Juglans regia TaxID=51240 RepID=A0A833SH48_JUGRE|nr:hypothetical protein F2P56_037011 [Juglans regia]